MSTKPGTKSGALGAIRLLWDGGLIGIESDARLLARFLEGPGEAAELAFAALVERHGPAVRRTCLAALGNPHDADDASQATFLVLARRAGSIRSPESLGPWLIAVARRVARKARSEAARRRLTERQLAERRPSSATAHDPSPPDPALAEELARLPVKHREAVAAVDLQGLSHAEAAAELGWPIGTLQARLHRGRVRLRARLIRRGLAPTAIPAAIAAEAARASWMTTALPPGWAAATAHAAVRFAGRAAAVSATTARLAEGVLAAIVLGRRAAVALGLCASLSAVGAIAVLSSGRGEPVGPHASPPIIVNSTGGPAIAPATPAPRPEDDPDASRYAPVVRGKVVDETGVPVAGVVVKINAMRWTPPDVTTAEDGTFAVPLQNDIPPDIQLDILAIANGGRLQSQSDLVDQGSSTTLTLEPTRTILAHVVDADGRPIEGAKVAAQSEWMGRTYGPVETDARGQARLLVPRHARVMLVNARKGGAGFDYHENFRSEPLTSDESLEAPEDVTLRLEGSRTIQVRVVDSSGSPASGVQVYPFSLRLPEKLADARLGGGGVAATTNPEGIATFDWIPDRIDGGIGFSTEPGLIGSPGHNVDYVPTSNDQPPTLKMRSTGTINGHVFDADNRPAVGAVVHAQGHSLEVGVLDISEAVTRTAAGRLLHAALGVAFGLHDRCTQGSVRRAEPGRHPRRSRTECLRDRFQARTGFPDPGASSPEAYAMSRRSAFGSRSGK